MTNSSVTLRYGRSCHVFMVCGIQSCIQSWSVTYRIASSVQSFVLLCRLNNFACDLDFERRRFRQYGAIITRCQKVQLFAIIPFASLQLLREAQGWCHESKKFFAVCANAEEL